MFLLFILLDYNANKGLWKHIIQQLCFIKTLQSHSIEVVYKSTSNSLDTIVTEVF